LSRELSRHDAARNWRHRRKSSNQPCSNWRRIAARHPSAPQPTATASPACHGGRRGAMSQTRRLAAVLAADALGYPPLTGEDREVVSIVPAPFDMNVRKSVRPHLRCWTIRAHGSQRRGSRDPRYRRGAKRA